MKSRTTREDGITAEVAQGGRPGAAVLGIDAAWTEKNPSGVALVVKNSCGWRLLALESSYRDFICPVETVPAMAAGPNWRVPSAAELFAAARKRCEVAIEIVAIDMPLSLSPISGRRAADDAVSRAYGARKCGTHVPTQRVLA